MANTILALDRIYLESTEKTFTIQNYGSRQVQIFTKKSVCKPANHMFLSKDSCLSRMSCRLLGWGIIPYIRTGSFCQYLSRDFLEHSPSQVSGQGGMAACPVPRENWDCSMVPDLSCFQASTSIKFLVSSSIFYM